MSRELEQQMELLTATLTRLAESQKSSEDKVNAAMQILEAKHTLGTVDGTDGHRPLSDQAFWQDCALDRAVINRIVQPFDSLMNMIPAFPTIHESHKYAMLTGNTVVPTPGQTPPATNCDPCRTLDHAWSACKLDFPLGRWCRRTKTLESNELIRRACMRLYDDFLFVGELDGMVPGSVPFMNAINNDADFLITSAVRRKLWEMARYFQEKMNRSLWTGDPTGDPNDDKDHWGLSSLIRGDYHDYPAGTGPGIETGGSGATTQAVCAALNGELKDFNNNCIGGNVNILYWLEMMEHNLYRTARGIGALPVDWVIVMTSEHWSELTRVLPCARAFMSCAGQPIGPAIAGQQTAAAQVTLDGATVIAERDRMMSSGSIALNGRSYPVIIDDFLPYTQSQVTVNGQQKTAYTADIWFIPLRAFGRPTLFYEFMDYSQLGPALSPLGGIGSDPWSPFGGFTDGGRWHIIAERVNWCFQIQMKTEARLVLLCPSLSGKLQNVRACPLQPMPRAVQPNQPLGTAYTRTGITATAPAP